MKIQAGTRLYVLDTHILIWYFTGNQRLPDGFGEIIDEARQLDNCLLVPTIVLAEALNLAEKRRVVFDFAHMYRFIREGPEFTIVEFGQDILDETIRTKVMHDIHDRIIMATARFYGASILTKDGVIRDSGLVDAL